jgi:hypothetical protein
VRDRVVVRVTEKGVSGRERVRVTGEMSVSVARDRESVRERDGERVGGRGVME